MTRLYRGKYLVTGDAAPIEDGALLVRDGIIEALGRATDLLRQFSGVDIVDFDNGLLVPLLVNAHTHLELTDYPQWAERAGETAEPGSFVDWLLQLIRTKQHLDRKQYALALKNGIDLSLAAGTGAVGDILAHHPAREAYIGTRLGGCLYLETLGRDPAVILRLKDGLDKALVERRIGQMNVGLSPHSPYTISRDYLHESYQRCQQQGLPCTTHLAESPEEVEFVTQSRGPMAERFYPAIGWETFIPPATGLRPVAYLQQAGGLFPGNLLVHGVQLEDDEIELLAVQKMRLALCPRSNARLKVGTAPVGKLLRAGVKLCLGTDSLASCASLSIWDEMAYAKHCFGDEIDAPTLFTMATRGGAEALGLQVEFGTLKSGIPARFQVLQPKSTIAGKDIFDYFVAPGCQDDIVQIYHQGRPLLSGIA